MRNTPISIETDQAQIVDRGSGKQNVQSMMNLAPKIAKNPVAHQFVRKWKGHDNKAEQQIADGKRRDEPILNCFQRFFGADCNADK